MAKCPWCKIKDKYKWFIEDGFFGIRRSKDPCDGGCPIVVLNDHKPELNEAERNRLLELFRRKFPNHTMTMRAVKDCGHFAINVYPPPKGRKKSSGAIYPTKAQPTNAR